MKASEKIAVLLNKSAIFFLSICLKACTILLYSFLRGISSAGRALRWQRRGQGFEPPMLHYHKPLITEGFSYVFNLYKVYFTLWLANSWQTQFYQPKFPPPISLKKWHYLISVSHNSKHIKFSCIIFHNLVLT